ncbi:DUF2270 domain-containing protein [bacterium]|nr:DUF2270 domain-containing protein [bacterium]
MSDPRELPYEQYGHEFTHAEWMQLMIHYYRGEMNRATVWRQRLDVTTNWAVGATAAMLTVILGSREMPHVAIVLPAAIVVIMLHIEARRYLYYDLWRSRLRMLERGLIAPALWREVAQREIEHEVDWRRKLAEDMHRARFHMPYSEAFGRRLQRNYTWLFLLNYGAWLLKLAICPQTALCAGDLVRHAALGPVPGTVVLIGATLLLIVCFALGPILTRHRHARGEALPYVSEQDTERWGIV